VFLVFIKTAIVSRVASRVSNHVARRSNRVF